MLAERGRETTARPPITAPPMPLLHHPVKADQDASRSRAVSWSLDVGNELLAAGQDAADPDTTQHLTNNPRQRSTRAERPPILR